MKKRAIAPGSFSAQLLPFYGGTLLAALALAGMAKALQKRKKE